LTASKLYLVPLGDTNIIRTEPEAAAAHTNDEK